MSVKNLNRMRARVFAGGYEGVTHAGLAVVRFDAEASVLLAQRAFDETDDPDVRETWETPGGSLEPGEEPFEAAVREFTEETGFELPPGEVINGWRAGPTDNYQGFVYEAVEFEAISDFEPNDEVQALGWFTVEEAQSLNLRPEMADFDWDLLKPVSGNEEAQMAAEDENALDESELDEIVEEEDLGEEDLEEPEFDVLDFVEQPIPIHGVIAPEEVESGDSRAFAAGSMTSRPLRIPFRWQKSDIGGHDGAVVTGSVDRIMRKDGLIHWEGLLIPSAESDELTDLIEFFGRYGVSVDGDKGALDTERTESSGVTWFNAVRAAGLTAVAIPAFPEAYVALGPHPEMPQGEGEELDAMVASGNLVGQFKRGSSVEPQTVEVLIPEDLGASGEAAKHVLSVGNGLKMARADAGQDSAKMIEVSGDLGAVARFLWEFGNSRLVDETVGEVATTPVVDTSVAAGVNVTDPDQALSQMRSMFRGVSLSGVPLDDLLSATPGARTAFGLDHQRVPELTETFVVHGAEPLSEEGAFAVFNRALVHGLSTFKRGPGWVTNPKETSRLHRYWTVPGQPGYQKVRWGTPGDWRRARALIGEKILKNSPEKARFLNQIISQWHFDALGYWPGELDKPGNKTSAQAKAERKAKLSSEVDNEGIEATDDGWEAVLVSSVSGNRVVPPLSYFHRHPDAGALVIEEPDENGIQRTYGYAGEWGVCHIGMDGRCVEPPRTGSDDYPEFHLGRTKTDQGYIYTGVLTYGVGHRDADTILSESPDQAYFDNINNAWAAVRVGEDERGIWFSGVVLPGVDPDHLVKIEASGQVSGEWLRGAMRACLTVNVPGFAVQRASAAYDEDGNVLALAASAFGTAAKVNGVEESECAPSPAERMAALREIDAEVRFAKLRSEWEG